MAASRKEEYCDHATRAHGVVGHMRVRNGFYFQGEYYASEEALPQIEQDFRALLRAAAKGRLEKVAQILNETKNKDINEYDFPRSKYGRNALVAAIRCRRHEMAQFLVERGANVNAIGECTGPLKEAVKLADLKMVQLLLDAGASPVIGARRPLHANLLYDACLAGDKCVAAVQELLRGPSRDSPQRQPGADPNFKTKRGLVPLLGSLRARCLPSARLLLDAGADPNVTHTKGLPVWNEVIYYKDSKDYLELLLGYGMKAKAPGDRLRASIFRRIWGSACDWRLLDQLARRGYSVNLSLRKSPSTPLSNIDSRFVGSCDQSLVVWASFLVDRGARSRYHDKERSLWEEITSVDENIKYQILNSMESKTAFFCLCELAEREPRVLSLQVLCLDVVHNSTVINIPAWVPPALLVYYGGEIKRNESYHARLTEYEKRRSSTLCSQSNEMEDDE